ncbi:ABC transporter ATP-binding protein [Rhizobium sp. SSA_523]|uniref:ABC transporter ATP-binding protein n=1 Tax=Rhizobium sp. SSA_523 TaxID=2952477 RepID=UPI0020902191|nr:ABC transporter ATP-binding protein [Rhizobium sp. SSA_523]MCO5732056.1 ABC transporter ATP-binding protein [Rhizobium sp. SSA_523]WKC22607.1 ABC transporter ATP-binding protein [Rhizobium sp. SSA_523]
MLRRRDTRPPAGTGEAAPALSILSISKCYGTGQGQSRGQGQRQDKVQALDQLSLSVPRGTIYGLLGPNGAGKSTLLRILAGLVRPDRGEIRIFGEAAGPATRRRLGMLIEAPSFYPFLTAREHLEMLSNASATGAPVDWILERIGLAKAADRRVSSFSLGMKQRLGIGCALVGQPEAIVLDEPTNGLDPDGILDMRALMRELAHRDGLTVLLSSHLLDEVERVCDRVAILKRGRLAAEGAVSALLDREGRFYVRSDAPDRVLAHLGQHAEPGDEGVYIRIDRHRVPDLIRLLVKAGIGIHEARWVKPDLETVFLTETRGDSL